jgi:hypothetical protein
MQFMSPTFSDMAVKPGMSANKMVASRRSLTLAVFSDTFGDGIRNHLSTSRTACQPTSPKSLYSFPLKD